LYRYAVYPLLEYSFGDTKESRNIYFVPVIIGTLHKIDLGNLKKTTWGLYYYNNKLNYLNTIAFIEDNGMSKQQFNEYEDETKSMILENLNLKILKYIIEKISKETKFKVEDETNFNIRIRKEITTISEEKAPYVFNNFSYVRDEILSGITKKNMFLNGKKLKKML
jgi:hypothetical protein